MTWPAGDDRPDAEPSVSGADTTSGGARDPAMDALIAASRVHRGNVMDDDYKPLTNPEVGRIRKTVTEFLEGQDKRPKDRVTRAKLAKAIGESKSTVSQVLACKYPEGKQDGFRKRDDILRKLDKHLALLRARRDSPQRSDFAWTGVAEEVRGVANTAVMLCSLAAVYGPAGIGKTLCLRALLDVFPGSVLLTINDGVHSVTTLMRELSCQLKLGTASFRYGMRRSIVECLRQSKRLVMIDEAHLASMDMLNCIRQLQDDTDCPVLLVGLPSLARMLLKGRGDDSKGATVYSRVTPSRDLTERCRRNGDRGEPLFGIGDIKRVFARGALRVAGDATAWLQALACMPEVGALRACNNAVRLAAHIAKQKGETEITLTLLLQASRLLHGVEGAKAIVNRIKERQVA